MKKTIAIGIIALQHEGGLLKRFVGEVGVLPGTTVMVPQDCWCVLVAGDNATAVFDVGPHELQLMQFNRHPSGMLYTIGKNPESFTWYPPATPFRRDLTVRVGNPLLFITEAVVKRHFDSTGVVVGALREHLDAMVPPGQVLATPEAALNTVAEALGQVGLSLVDLVEQPSVAPDLPVQTAAVGQPPPVPPQVSTKVGIPPAPPPSAFTPKPGSPPVAAPPSRTPSPGAPPVAAPPAFASSPGAPPVAAPPAFTPSPGAPPMAAPPAFTPSPGAPPTAAPPALTPSPGAPPTAAPPSVSPSATPPSAAPPSATPPSAAPPSATPVEAVASASARPLAPVATRPSMPVVAPPSMPSVGAPVTPAATPPSAPVATRPSMPVVAPPLASPAGAPPAAPSPEPQAAAGVTLQITQVWSSSTMELFGKGELTLRIRILGRPEAIFRNAGPFSYDQTREFLSPDHWLGERHWQPLPVEQLSFSGLRPDHFYRVYVVAEERDQGSADALGSLEWEFGLLRAGEREIGPTRGGKRGQYVKLKVQIL